MTIAKTLELPTQEYLQERFSYVGGRLYHKKNIGGKKRGEVAGYRGTNGYWVVNVDGAKYQLHRVIYQWWYGDLTTDTDIDHIDRNPGNNNIINLRKGCRTLGSVNRGSKGYTKVRDKYKAQIWVNGEQCYLGSYNTAEEASNVYEEVKEVFVKCLTENTGLEELYQKIEEIRSENLEVKENKGYCFDKQAQKYKIKVGGKYYGYCKTEEEAIQKVKEVREKIVL